MAERGRDREFRFPQISYIDYKQIEIDRTLLNLFPRLKYDGYLGRVKKLPFQLTIEEFLAEFTDEKYKDVFVGFAEHKDIVYKWLETDLLDLVNRGHPIKQAVVSPRPLHGNTYKFRNTRHARDYGTAEQVYWMLYHAPKGPIVLNELTQAGRCGQPGPTLPALWEQAYHQCTRVNWRVVQVMAIRRSKGQLLVVGLSYIAETAHSTMDGACQSHRSDVQQLAACAAYGKARPALPGKPL